MELNSSQVTSLYLHNASHTVVSSPLAMVYTQKLLKLNHQKSINYPLAYTNGCRNCKNCNQIHIPGINVRVSLKRGKLVYKCMNCGYRGVIVELANDFNADIDNSVGNIVINNGEKNDKTDGNTNRNGSKSQATADKKSKDKKKRKSLASMLQSKKQKTDSLDLMEFMKQ